MFALACAALFWPGLIGGEVPAFRDAFHFYYPQAVWLDQCALQGEYFPQWQCHESLGVSVPGETTSALYYPLRIAWFLPSLSVAQRFSVFVLAHLLLAGYGMQYACKRLKLRREAGWMAGATFALSCPLLFQHNNLVFLCSAAWLGFVLAELSCWLQHGEVDSPRPRIPVLAGAIAMMVLAGDPHTAVNVVVLATFFAVMRGFALRSYVRLGTSLMWLAAVVLLAIGLSAVQSIPSFLWAAQSHRWLGNSDALSAGSEPTIAPVSVVPAALAKILAKPTTRPSSAVYEFSLSPWHLLTALWPTLGGSFAPENSRTFSLIAAEGRMWIPSLYFGVGPLLLLIGGFRRPKGAKRNGLLLAALFALLASFGNYSMGWLVREFLSAGGADSLSRKLPPDHYSSLYGWLVEGLPGYSLFRYPAKWSAVVAACATLAAATRMGQLSEANLLQASWVQRVVLWLSGLGLIVTLACSSFFNLVESMPAQIRHDAWLGAPTNAAMFRQLLTAFAIPLLVLGVLVLVRLRERKWLQSPTRASLPVHAIFAWVSLLETCIVATCWCSFVPVKPTEPKGDWDAEFIWANASAADIERDAWLTDATQDASKAITDYQRVFALGKLALISQQHNLAAILSIEPERVKRLRTGLAQVDDLSTTQPELDVMLAWLGVERRLVRTRMRGEPAAFSWQRIPDAKRLCELRFAEPSPALTATLNWKWVRCGRLEIRIDSPSDCSMLVRQFNEGGWRIVADREAIHGSPVTRDSSGLFVECAIAAGKSNLMLERVRWPLQVGLTISLASSLLAIGLTAHQLRMASATKS